MKVCFLGTGTSQGVPVIACNCEVCKSDDVRDNRLRSSILLSTGDYNIVIDAGPDFRQQLLRAQTQNLDAIFFTHEHKDHLAGLDDVRAFNFKQQQYMPLYATKRVQYALRREYEYAFNELNYPGAPMLSLLDITNNQSFYFKDLQVLPIEVMHGSMPVTAFRMGDFSYITDANYIAPNSMDLFKGTKTLVINALRNSTHHSHYTLKEAIAVSQEIGAERVYFTHISHLLGKHHEVSKILPENFYLAYDGLNIEVA